MPRQMLYFILLFDEAVRNGSSAAELLAWKPWATAIADINTEIARTTESQSRADADDSASSMPAPSTQCTPPAPSQCPSWMTSPEGVVSSIPDVDVRQEIEAAAKRLAQRLVSLHTEPATQQQLAAIIETSPLGNVKPSVDTGNVIVLIDCNSFGESDAQPMYRVCPMNPPHTFQKFLRATLLGRCGSAEPMSLPGGTLFMCIDGGRERKRVFMKPLVTKKIGTDPERTVCHTLTMHMSEKSWRKRRKHAHGIAKLTQHIHVVATAKTMKSIKYSNFSYHVGSTRGDIIGPVELDGLDCIPRMTPAEKTEYLGKRRCAAGGKLEVDDDADGCPDQDIEEEEDELAESETTVPVSYHVLPVTLPLDLIIAFGGKHVLDFTPNPMNLAAQCVKRGISYFGICGTNMAKDFLANRIATRLMGELLDSQSPLGDQRFIQITGEEAPDDVEAEEEAVDETPAPAAENPKADPQPVDGKGYLFFDYVCARGFAPVELCKRWGLSRQSCLLLGLAPADFSRKPLGVEGSGLHS